VHDLAVDVDEVDPAAAGLRCDERVAAGGKRRVMGDEADASAALVIWSTVVAKCCSCARKMQRTLGALHRQEKLIVSNGSYG